MVKALDEGLQCSHKCPRREWKDSCSFEEVYIVLPCFTHSLSSCGMQYPVWALLDISDHSPVGMTRISHQLVLLVEPFAPKQLQPKLAQDRTNMSSRHFQTSVPCPFPKHQRRTPSSWKFSAAKSVWKNRSSQAFRPLRSPSLSGRQSSRALLNLANNVPGGEMKSIEKWWNGWNSPKNLWRSKPGFEHLELSLSQPMRWLTGHKSLDCDMKDLTWPWLSILLPEIKHISFCLQVHVPIFLGSFFLQLKSPWHSKMQSQWRRHMARWRHGWTAGCMEATMAGFRTSKATLATLQR